MAWKETITEQTKKMNIGEGGNAIRYVPVKVNKSDKPLLVIGLGGTGLRIARQTKDLFLERFKPAVNPLPQLDPLLPPTTRFLAIDTNDDDLRQLAFSEAERCSIGVSTLGAMLSTANRQLLPPYILDWLNPDLKSQGGTGMDGAQGIRQIGRFDLFQNVAKVIASIKTALSQIMHGKGEIYVVIAAGMAGGTGSGTFLDMPYLVRKAAEEMSLKGRIRIIGYLVTPDVYTALSANDADTATLLRANGYAAMKELDYWMEATDRHDPFTQQYSQTISVAWEAPPFDDCVLLSSQNVAGNAPQQAYETLRGVVAEYITFLFAEEDAVKNTTDEKLDYGFSYYSYRSNVKEKLVAKPRKYDVSRRYTAIGAANGQLPLQELMIYEGIYLFKTIRELYDRHADHYKEQVFSGFIAPIVGQDIRNAFQAVPSPTPRKSTIKQIRHSDRIAPHDPSIDKSLSVYHEALQLAAKGMDMEDLIQGKASNLEQAVIQMFTDPNLGPFYAARFINRKPGYYLQTTDSFNDMAEGSFDLRAHLHSLMTTASNESNAAFSAYKQAKGRAEPEYTVIRTALLEPLQNGPTATRYYPACEEENTAIKKHYEKAVMARLYQAMIDKLDFLADYVIKPYLTAVEELVRTYRQIETYVATPAYRANRSPYDKDIVDIQIIRQNLTTHYLTETKTGELLATLFTDMMRAYLIDRETGKPETVRKEELWIIPDERTNHPVALNIRDNLQRVLNAFFRKYNSETTMVSFLKMQYPEYINPDSTLNLPNVMNQLVQTLTSNASPMFLPNGTDNPQQTALSASYITVPKDVPGIGDALASDGREIKRSVITDRIFWITSLDGVSLYHYGDLPNCERDYIAKAILGTHIGTHLWEGKALNWKTLPNPLPRIARDKNYNNAVQVRQDDEFAARISALREQGFITLDEAGQNVVLHFKSAVTEEICNAYPDLAAAQQLAPEEAQKVLERLSRSREPRILKMDNAVLKSYRGTDAENMVSLANDMLMQRPALIRQLEAEVWAIANTEKALRDVVGDGDHRAVLLRTAHRLADLLAFGVLKAPNRMHYTYEHEAGNPQIFYNTMTDNATYAAKYNAAYGLEIGIAEKMLATSDAAHPDHGKYYQLAELEQAMADELGGIDSDRLEALGAAFLTHGSALKAKLTADKSALTPKQARELGVDAGTKAFLISFKQAMLDQLKTREVGLGVNL